MNTEMDKKKFFQTAQNVTVGKSDQCVHFISFFIASKLIISLIIQYASLNNIPKISLNPTHSLRLELWAVSGL
jgi:hypothetical protein